MAKIGYVLVLSILGILLQVACSSSSSGGSTATVSSFPTGFAVSSVTNASSSSSFISVLRQFLPKESIHSISAGDSLEDKADALENIAKSKTASDCEVLLQNFSTSAPGVSCYGPKLAFVNHLEGTPDANDTQEVGDHNGGNDGSDGVLPGGDLGIWSANEVDGTACSAAKINADIQGINYKVDNALMMSAALTCVMNAEGSALPGVGDSLDLTTPFAAAITSANPSASITAATIERQADSGSNPVYLYTISGTFNSFNVTLYLKHSPQNTTNTEYVGKLWTVVSGTPSFGFSVSYEKTATELLYKMTSSNFPNNEISSNMFNSDGTFKLDGTWNGNISITQAEMRLTNFTGSFAYAWQAGTGDSHARIFNAYTETSGADVLGYAFFGFGQNFSNAGPGQASDAQIDTFICNWAGPGGNHTGLAGRGQKQFMKLVAGKWVPSPDEADPNKIDYSPVTSCNHTLNQADGNTRVFEYTTNFTTSFPASWTGSSAAVTHELVTLSSDPEYTNYVAPTAPTEL